MFMKGMIFSIISVVCLVSTAHSGEEPKIYTDQDLKRYGATSSSVGGANACMLVDYYSFERVTKRITTPGIVQGITNLDATGFGQTYGTVLPGGTREEKETCIDVVVKNIDTKTQQIDGGLIEVITLRGKSVTPTNGKTFYISAGESTRIQNICFGQLLSGIAEIRLRCY